MIGFMPAKEHSRQQRRPTWHQGGWTNRWGVKAVSIQGAKRAMHGKSTLESHGFQSAGSLEGSEYHDEAEEVEC